MIKDVVVEPMTEQFIVWRCLHEGPLACDTIDQWTNGNALPLERYRERNIPLLVKLTRTYGSCAIIARDVDQVVGCLRFYPKAVCKMKDAGGLCLQQDPPGGPLEDFAENDFPEPAQIEDKTLVVHCLMMGSPLQKENPYQRKGIGTRMVRALIEWAKVNGWEVIEADSFEELPIIYDSTGSAGHIFWEKLGFSLVDRQIHPELRNADDFSEFVTMLENQAKAVGLPPETARDRLLMRLDLT